APGGGTFAEFTAGVAYGAQGQIAFTAVLDDGNTGVFLEANGVGTSIARTGGAAGSGLMFTSLRLIDVASDGRVGYRAGVLSAPDGLFISGRIQPGGQVGGGQPAGGTLPPNTGAPVNDAAPVPFPAARGG